MLFLVLVYVTLRPKSHVLFRNHFVKEKSETVSAVFYGVFFCVVVVYHATIVGNGIFYFIGHK